MLKIRDILIIVIAGLLAGCSSDDITTGGFSVSDEWEIKPGDPVMFTTNVYGKVGTTRTVTYEPVGAGYTFTYFMYKEVESVSTFVAKGSTVYWPDINSTAYGFIAKTGTLEENGEFADLSADQETEAKLINEDQLLGYGAVDADVDKGIIHYRTAANWKNDNTDLDEADKKNIRLYMQHRRAKITIILKAGTNVTSEDLASASVTIYSYPGAIAVDKPLKTTVGGDPHYTAIVEPYDYTSNGGQNIAQITLTRSGSNKTITYKPSNDPSEDKSAYNLAADNAGNAGKHLTITITLTAPTP